MKFKIIVHYEFEYETTFDEYDMLTDDDIAEHGTPALDNLIEHIKDNVADNGPEDFACGYPKIEVIHISE